MTEGIWARAVEQGFKMECGPLMPDVLQCKLRLWLPECC